MNGRREANGDGGLEAEGYKQRAAHPDPLPGPAGRLDERRSPSGRQGARALYRRHPRLAPSSTGRSCGRPSKPTSSRPGRRATRSRGHGTIAVALGFLGLALTAVTPFLAKLLSFSPLFPKDPDTAERWIGGAAAALIVLGTLGGFQQALIGQAKRRVAHPPLPGRAHPPVPFPAHRQQPGEGRSGIGRRRGARRMEDVPPG